MEKVIQSLEDRQYALLESPTGTGKTLSLLCATLSWAKENGDLTIVYASRTHSQLSNVIKELKRTSFRPTVSHIASRKKLCLLDAVKKRSPGMQASLCRQLRQTKRCPYHFDEKQTSEAEALTQKCLDIEDFVSECRTRNYCPYLVAQLNAKKSQLVLTPYTYIVDAGVRDHLPDDLFWRAIVILDEAHNVPDALAGSMSFEIPFHLVKQCAFGLGNVSRNQFLSKLNKENKLDLAELTAAGGFIGNLNACLIRLAVTDDRFKSLMLVGKDVKEAHQPRDADFLYDLLDECGINETTAGRVREVLDTVSQLASTINLQQSELTGVDVVNRFLKVMYKTGRSRMENVEFISKYFGVNLTNEPAINLTCFSAAPGFEDVMGLAPHTVIMTSGTLSPMASFEEELGARFPVQLENGHIADPSQVFVGLLSKGPQEQNYQFTFANRKNAAMKKDLIDGLQSVYSSVPSGVLTFFPSFAFMDDISKLGGLNATGKKLFVEPRDGEKLTDVLASFHRSAAAGAAMLAVCRGKTSEGLDFADDAARCVCVVGIPFPNAGDFRVIQRRDWLDNIRPGAGSRWYTESAIRAVNQSIGRAIRHRNDYAVILLMDERYVGFQGMLSKWIRKSIVHISSWDDLTGGIDQFFRNKRSRPMPRRPGPRPTAGLRPQGSLACEQRQTIATATTRPSSISTAVKKKTQTTAPVLERAVHLIAKTKDKKEKVSQSEALTSMFDRALVDSEKKSMPGNETGVMVSFGKKKEPVDRKRTLDELLGKKSVKEEQIVVRVGACVQCGDKNAKITKSCGHMLCEACSAFADALNLDCPECR